jgi:hypothetical protein
MHNKLKDILSVFLILLIMVFASLLCWEFYKTGIYLHGAGGIILFYIVSIILFNPKALKFPAINFIKN